jgi:hypothetical protein
LITQLRSAAAAALTLATCGTGATEPAPVVNSRLPTTASRMAGSTARVAVIAP